MKLAPALAICQIFALAAASSFSLFGGQQILNHDDKDTQVPGDSPLHYCKPEQKDDLAVIEHVNLTPNPPQSGHNLTIDALGVLKEDVEEGAYVDLQVKYGLIKLINTRADLCEQMKAVDMECPLKKGETNLTKIVELPKEIPPGTYHVTADLFTKDDEPITCLTATVHFKL